MRKLFIIIGLFLLITPAAMPLFSAEPAEDFQPLNTGMTLNFFYIVEHMEKKDRTWQVKIVKNSFPESLTFTWIRREKDGAEYSGSRILADLTGSRDFNPSFKKNETKATTDTAPWLSVNVLSELRDTGKSDSLTVKDKIIFPLLINDKPEAVHALELNKGITVWNNLKNPLVLQYEPLGIPLITGITGWKLVSIQY